MLDAWYVPENSATAKAKKIYAEFVENRIQIEKKINHHGRWPLYLQCTRCLRHGITKKYKSETMLHVYGLSRRKTGDKLGKIGVNWRHYCPECSKKYKPYNK